MKGEERGKEIEPNLRLWLCSQSAIVVLWRSFVTSRVDKLGCSIVKVMKIIRNMPKVKNDFELSMKATNILVVKENRKIFVALEDLVDQIAQLKHKQV